MLDEWFGNLNLLVRYMVNDGVRTATTTAAIPGQTVANGDNGKKLERAIHDFENEGGPPPQQPL